MTSRTGVGRPISRPEPRPVARTPAIRAAETNGHSRIPVGQPGESASPIATPAARASADEPEPASASCAPARVRNGSVMPPPPGLGRRPPARADTRTPRRRFVMAPKTPTPSRTNGHTPATLAAAEARPGRPRDPARSARSATLPIGLPGQGQGVELPAAQRDPGRLDGALRAVQEASLARRRVRPSTSSTCCSTSTPRSRTRSSTSSPSGSRASAASPSATRVTPPS